MAAQRKSLASTAAWRAGNRQDGRDSRWWRLVWCHERCFLPECDELRLGLSTAARNSGSALICLKSAPRLGSWLAERTRTQRQGCESEASVPYALITDWRVVMSCAEVAMQQAAESRPAFTVLLCQQQEQLDLVLPWAGQAPPSMGPVYVCTDVGCTTSFVAALASRLANGTPLPSNFLAADAAPPPAAAIPGGGGCCAPEAPPEHESERGTPPPPLPGAGGRRPQPEQPPRRIRLQLQHQLPEPAGPRRAQPPSTQQAPGPQQRHGHSHRDDVPGHRDAVPALRGAGRQFHPEHSALAQEHGARPPQPWALSPLSALPADSGLPRRPAPASWHENAHRYREAFAAHGASSSSSSVDSMLSGGVVSQLLTPLSSGSPPTPATPGLTPAERRLLGPDLGSRSDAELDRMLRAAMPESYDD